MYTRSKLLAGAAVLGSLWMAGCDEVQSPIGVDRQDELSRQGVGSDAKTPFDQNESPEDIRITADIRKAILATDGMSINAQNVKVITRHGVVTLRGVVETPGEAEGIADIVRRTAGVTQLQNELQVAD